jgi:shikimate kinase
MTPAEIIRRDGEPAFRAIEREALTKWISADVVLATGGGVVVSEACRELLKAQTNVAWLQARIESLATRSQSQDRPLLDGDRQQRLRQIAVEREPWYREVSSFAVDSEGSIDEVVERLLAGVRT